MMCHKNQRIVALEDAIRVAQARIKILEDEQSSLVGRLADLHYHRLIDQTRAVDLLRVVRQYLEGQAACGDEQANKIYQAVSDEISRNRPEKEVI